MNTKTCIHCGVAFTPAVGQYEWSLRSQVCSEKCRNSYNYSLHKMAIIANRPERHCKECGASIPPERDGNIRFCSAPCMKRFHHASNNERRRQRNLVHRTGRTCKKCNGPIADTKRAGTIFCSKACYLDVTNRRILQQAPAKHRQRLYGLTPEQYEAMLEAQGHRCAICHTDTPRGKGWQVDHDHVTGRVRGILCTNCNSGLGRFEDEPARFRSAAAYLEAQPM